jgi:hypothetical protein
MKTAIPKTFLLFTFSTLFVFSFFGCSPNEPKPPEPKPEKTVLLSVTDFSPTEIYLELVTENLSSDKNVEIYRDESKVFNFALNGTDTAVVDDSLFPSSSYSYHSLVIEDGEDTVYTDTITAATMDTTSHDFTWETYEFGGVNGSSYFSDVAIIDENDIWAVGEIHTEADFDSAGNYVGPYNAAHWNGEEWELKRIIVNFHGNEIIIPLDGIFAFDSSDIWLVGSLPIHGDGKNWRIYDVREITNSNLSLSSAWGSNSSNMYFVGLGGSIAHYDGKSWEKIESGEGGNATELPFQDIYGYNNKIYCIASELFSDINSELYAIENKKTKLDDDRNLGVSSVTLYIIKKKLYVFGYYRLVRTVGKNGWETLSEPVNFDGYSKIRGIDYNDIVSVGSFGKIDHYNGSSWRNNRIRDKTGNLIDFSSVSIKNNIVCAVGRGRVIIVIGRR